MTRTADGRPVDAVGSDNADADDSAGSFTDAGQRHGSEHRGARVLWIPPPAYYAAGFVAGSLLDSAAVSFPIGGRPAVALIGVVIAAAGAALALSGVVGVVRHQTTIVPHHPVSSLVTTGVYRISRNPMYAGLAIVYLGGALIAGSWWPLVLLPLVLFAVQRLVIRPEERYLTEHFGRTYGDYRARVRRWL
jgi:protein-S-isoprenylcysteine O-methyltransferase Ste14